MALVIFDLDGTLIDSNHGLGKAMNMTLEDLGFPTHTYEKYEEFIGGGLTKLVYLALPEDKKDLHMKAYDKMYKNYETCYDFELEIYKGMEDCLTALVEAGHKIAVASNKPDKLTKAIVARYFSSYDFELVLGASEVYKKKPDTCMVDLCMEKAGVSKEDTILVGDSNFDIMVSTNAGIRSIYVPWGYRSWEQIKDLNPSFRVEKASEIVDIVKSLAR